MAKITDFRTKLPKLDNKETEELLANYLKTKSVQDFLKAAESVRKCTVFLPGTMDQNRRVSAAVLKTTDGKNLVAVYTSAEQFQGRADNLPSMLALPYSAVNELVLNLKNNGEQLDGLVINPFTHNVAFQRKMVEAIATAEKKQKESGEPAFIELDLPKSNLPQIDNAAVNEKALAFHKASGEEDRRRALNELLNSLYHAKVVIGLGQSPSGQDVPELVIDKNKGDKRLAIYTDPNLTVRQRPTCKVTVVLFETAAEMVLQLDDAVGITMFTPEAAINFSKDLLKNVIEVNQKRDGLAARQKFESQILPKAMFEEGQSFIDELLSKKEACIDALYEKTYYNVRMYPYLEEDFKVEALGIDAHTDAIRVEFPKRDMTITCASHAYLIWDNEAKAGKYFALVQQAPNAYVLLEVSGKGIRSHGAAPEESMELRTILELAQKTE